MLLTERRYRLQCDTCSDEFVLQTQAPHAATPGNAVDLAVESGYVIRDEWARCRSCERRGRTSKAQVEP